MLHLTDFASESVQFSLVKYVHTGLSFLRLLGVCFADDSLRNYTPTEVGLKAWAELFKETGALLEEDEELEAWDKLRKGMLGVCA